MFSSDNILLCAINIENPLNLERNILIRFGYYQVSTFIPVFREFNHPYIVNIMFHEKSLPNSHHDIYI